MKEKSLYYLRGYDLCYPKGGSERVYHRLRQFFQKGSGELQLEATSFSFIQGKSQPRLACVNSFERLLA